MESDKEKITLFANEFYLTAAEVNSQCEMPLSRLVTLIIDTATAHANALGAGYARMMEDNTSWVLSRLSIDLDRMPSVNRTYCLYTWVDSLSRLFSDRLFELRDVETGETIGWSHTTWMAIDMDTRKASDLTRITSLSDVIISREFHGGKSGKLVPLRGEPDGVSSWRFKVSDIDVNRHVTTRRYIDLITDIFPLEHYDNSGISRFEIAFKHEARYGQESLTRWQARPGEPGVYDIETSVDSVPCNISRIKFINRH